MAERGTDKQRPEHDELSRVYAELARESVPEELDRKILDLAVRKRTRKLSEWSKPIAIAATITICFALLPELTERSQQSPAGNRGSDYLTAPDALRSSLPETAKQQTAPEVAAAMAPAEKTLPTSREMVAHPNESGANDTVIPSLAIEAQADSASPDASASRCPVLARESPETWWQCIRELRERTMDAEADAEIELLSATFPKFELPE